MANINVATGVDFEFGTTGDDSITLTDALVDTTVDTLNGNGGTDTLTLSNSADSLLAFLGANGVLTYTDTAGSEHWDLDTDGSTATSAAILNGGIGSVTFATGEVLQAGVASSGTTALTAAITAGSGAVDFDTARAYEWDGEAITSKPTFTIGTNANEFTVVSVDGVSAAVANFSNGDGQFNLNGKDLTFTPNSAAILAQGDKGDTATFTYDVVLQNNTTNEQSTVSITFSQTIGYTEDADTFSGTSTGTLEQSLGGNDVIAAADGDDSIDGGAGNDDLKGENGNDNIVGGAGVDTLRGGNGNDELTAGGTEDGNNLGGGAGSDVILGNSGDDFIFGGNGDDSIAGSDATAPGELGISNTVWGLNGGDGDDVINGGSGDDLLFGGISNATGDDDGGSTSGNDTLRGGDGDDTLFGGDGNDELRGGAGDDVYSGGAGADKMYVSLGNDTMNGGAGDDIFFLRDDSGHTIINGFTSGDQLNVEGLGYSNLADVLATSYETDAGVVIVIDEDTTVTLASRDLTDLADADFDFA